MVKWTLYDEVTGKVLQTGEASDEEQAQLQATGGGRIVTVAVNPKTQIVDPATNTPVAKVAMKVGATLTSVNKTVIVADGYDAVVISNIPNGAKYDVRLPTNLGLMQPQDDIINDGSLTLTTTVAGEYTVILSYANFLDFVVTFNAN